MKNLFIKSFLLLSVLSLTLLFTGCNDLSENSAENSIELEEVVVDEAMIEATKGIIPGSCFDLIVPDASPLLAGTGYRFEVANADCSKYRYSFNENRSDFVGRAGGCNWEALEPLHCGTLRLTVLREEIATGLICGRIYTFTGSYPTPTISYTPSGDIITGNIYKFSINKVWPGCTTVFTYSLGFKSEYSNTGFVSLLARAAGWQWVEVTLKNSKYGCSVKSKRYNYYVYNVKK